MFCPKCAAQNADDAKFCRACGADVSLVPQAVSGQLAERLGSAGEDAEGRGHRRRHGRGKEAVNIERAVRSLFMGVAFIFVAFAVKTWAPAGSLWWFWMFLPAAGMLADGVATFLRLREERQRLTPTAFAPAHARTQALPPSNPGEIIQPPSVTEATTRHLGVPVERKPNGV
jgi:hypothetical protein